MSRPTVVRDADGDIWYWEGTEYRCAPDDDIEWVPQSTYEGLEREFGPLEVVVGPGGTSVTGVTKSERIAALEQSNQLILHKLENLDERFRSHYIATAAEDQRLRDAHNQLRKQVEKWSPIGPAVFDNGREDALRDGGLHTKRPLPADLLDRLEVLEGNFLPTAFRKRVTDVVSEWALYGPGTFSILEQKAFNAERMKGAIPGQKRALPPDLLDKFDQLKDTIEHLRENGRQLTVRLRTLEEFRTEHVTVHEALDEDIDDFEVDVRKLKVAVGPDNPEPFDEQSITVKSWGVWNAIPGTNLEVKLNVSIQPSGTQISLRKARD